MASRFGSLSRSLISAARATSLASSSPPLRLLGAPHIGASSLLHRSITTESGDDVSSGVTRKKVNKKMKAANNSSEFLSYMGGMDSDQKLLVKKLISFRMRGGKRTKVRSIFYETLHHLAKTESDVIKVTSEALENVKPICEVERVGRAGTIYEVPKIVPRERQQTLAVRWILEAAEKRRSRNTTPLSECLSAEIMDAYQKRGAARKKRETVHSVATNNRSFAHFRWW
uniref:Ribosomal protein S7 n=1 Tax=Monsonia emarginata TaxID=28966 RepID=A0A0G2YFH0_9ROSI|nr:ribosomal protein S7 [Monsonia emarginata]